MMNTTLFFSLFFKSSFLLSSFIEWINTKNFNSPKENNFARTPQQLPHSNSLYIDNRFACASQDVRVLEQHQRIRMYTAHKRIHDTLSRYRGSNGVEICFLSFSTFSSFHGHALRVCVRVWKMMCFLYEIGFSNKCDRTKNTNVYYLHVHLIY